MGEPPGPRPAAAGVSSLVALCGVASLEVVRLDLTANDVGDPGACALASFGCLPAPRRSAAHAYPQPSSPTR